MTALEIFEFEARNFARAAAVTIDALRELLGCPALQIDVDGCSVELVRPTADE